MTNKWHRLQATSLVFYCLLVRQRFSAMAWRSSGSNNSNLIDNLQGQSTPTLASSNNQCSSSRHISEGAAPCPYCLEPDYPVLSPELLKNTKKLINFSKFVFCKKKKLPNVMAVLVVSDSRCKNACNCLHICARVFHQSPTKLCPDLVSFACWIVPELWSFARQIVPRFFSTPPFSQPSCGTLNCE